MLSFNAHFWYAVFFLHPTLLEAIYLMLPGVRKREAVSNAARVDVSVCVCVCVFTLELVDLSVNCSVILSGVLIAHSASPATLASNWLGQPYCSF